MTHDCDRFNVGELMALLLAVASAKREIKELGLENEAGAKYLARAEAKLLEQKKLLGP